MEHTIDATKQSLGRTASMAAYLLLGKGDPSFQKNKVASVKVSIVNVSKVKFEAKKLLQKNYLRYSGYPGGLKSLRMEEVIEKKGVGEVYKKAVYGMIPSNRLRSHIMKNLIISE